MDLKTGYFAKEKKYRELGYTCISIARKTPSWFNGGSIPSFAPTYNLLQAYKMGLVSEEYYTDVYLRDLSKVDIEGIINTFTSDSKIVFLCYETSDKFCHRHIFADYVNMKYRYNIEELIV